MSACPMQAAPPARALRRAWSALVRWLPGAGRSSRAALDALQQSIDAVVGIDHRNRVVFYNPAAERLWGLPRARVMGANVSQLVPPPWRSEHDRLIERHRRGGENRIVGTFREAPIQRADGSTRWVSLAISTTTSQGRIGYTAFVRDVTVERDARESIRQTLEQAIDAVVSVDAHLRITFCNAAAERLWSTSRERVIGRHVRVLLHADVLGGAEQALASAPGEWLDRFVGTTVEMPIPRSDGKPVWGRISVARVQVDERTSYTAFVKDITETRAIRLARDAGEHRLKQLLENLPNVAIMGYGGDFRVTYWNLAAERMLGHRSDEVQGQLLPDLILPPRLRAAALEAMERLHGTGKLQPPGELKLRHKKGHEVIVQANHVCLSLPGQPFELYSACIDLSDRKAAEADRLALQIQLRESQKMEALGTLAGGIAHDFNNIVAAILGNIELALLDIPDPHAARESLHEVRKAGRRARDLVQQILTFGRRQAPAFERVDLKKLVLESRSMLHTAVPPGISLELDVDPQTPDVTGNATQLEQVLLNLCTNAAHALEGRAHGLIKVRLHPCNVPPPPHGRRVLDAPDPGHGRIVLLSVTDDGCGMAPDTLARIFEPFFTTKPTGKGTGLGLPVVHGILRDHKARLEVDSSPGRGTRFLIGLQPLPNGPTQAAGPDGQDEVARTAMGRPPAGAGGCGVRPCHLVYVDDDDAIVSLMERTLTRAGYRVSAYVDPVQAVQRIVELGDAVDVVLTDYNMPNMNGIELTRTLRTARPHLPVLMTTGHITDGLRDKAPEAGVNALIYKPDSVDDMFTVVHEAVRRLSLPCMG